MPKNNNGAIILPENCVIALIIEIMTRCFLKFCMVSFFTAKKIDSCRSMFRVKLRGHYLVKLPVSKGFRALEVP